MRLILGLIAGFGLVCASCQQLDDSDDEDDEFGDDDSCLRSTGGCDESATTITPPAPCNTAGCTSSGSSTTASPTSANTLPLPGPSATDYCFQSTIGCDDDGSDWSTGISSSSSTTGS